MSSVIAIGRGLWPTDEVGFYGISFEFPIDETRHNEPISRSE